MYMQAQLWCGTKDMRNPVYSTDTSSLWLLPMQAQLLLEPRSSDLRAVLHHWAKNHKQRAVTSTPREWPSTDHLFYSKNSFQMAEPLRLHPNEDPDLKKQKCIIKKKYLGSLY